MDARYMRQPPPMSDPNHPPPPPPPQAAAPWYPNQFNYQPSHPPPPHHSSWPPHSDNHHQPSSSSSSSYPPPHQPPYPAHPQHHNPYLPPPPPQHMPPPPPPPPPPQYSHPNYSQPNPHQSWGNQSWGHQQNWEYTDGIIPNNHEEDWAARARAWAASKAANETQQQSQFTHVARPEEHTHGYHDQYQLAVDPHYTGIQQPTAPASSHQQFSTSLGNPQRLPANHPQESSSFSSGPSSRYVSDEHVPYTTRDGTISADPTPVYPYQGVNAANSSVFQQEVPSSYSSFPGSEEVGDGNVHFHSRSSLPVSSSQEGQFHFQPRLSDSGRSVSAEQRQFTYGDPPAESMPDQSDRPLEFAPGFYREYDSHNQCSQASYGNPDSVGAVDAITPVPHVSALAPPVVPGMFDPSFVAPPIPGHAGPMFGQITGPNFHPPVPTVGAPFGLGVGPAVHPLSTFPGETNGFSNVSERPKKASVPNWLREEIIKNKSVITSSSQDHLAEDPNTTEDPGEEKSYMKGGLGSRINIDSSRASDNEDEDEDDIETARTAAINQEIKRVLTEVLMKVTDELFDEIASKVLAEDDLMIDVEYGVAPPSGMVLSSPPAAPTPKASAKVLVPVKGKEAEINDASERSSSGLPGDLLGLASYASDDDEEMESSSKRHVHAAHSQPRSKFSETAPQAVENGSSQAEVRGPSKTTLDNNQKKTSLEVLCNPSMSRKGLCDDEPGKDLNHENGSSLKEDIGVGEHKMNVDGERMVDGTDAFYSKDGGGKHVLKPELQQGHVEGKKLSAADASLSRQSGSNSDKHDMQEVRKRFVDKDTIKHAEADNHLVSSDPRRDERHVRKEKTDDRKGLKDKGKDRDSKPGEKVRESDSRRTSSKDDKIDYEKVKRSSLKDDSSRKRERERDEKEDRSRHRSSRDSGKHRRRRSPSTSNRVKHSKDTSANESSDGASEDSRQRKLHSRKRSLSPSPTRSKRRQVSRSPHSKHSQRRHSPYSSLETTRRKRSKSRSPVRHRR